MRLQDNADIERTLQTDGFSGRYVVSVETSRDQPLPIVKLEVTAHDPQTARAMVVRLIEIAATAVTAQQQPANLPANEQISLVALSSGENVVEVNTTTIRAVVVVVLAGLILTIGAAVGVDALARAGGPPTRSDPGQPIPANPVAPGRRPGPPDQRPPIPRRPVAAGVVGRPAPRTHERTRERPPEPVRRCAVERLDDPHSHGRPVGPRWSLPRARQPRRRHLGRSTVAAVAEPTRSTRMSSGST